MNRSECVKILVADDQLDILRSIEILFKSEGMECVTCSSPTQVIRKFEQQQFDLILLDLNYQTDTTSGREGFQLIEHIRTQSDTIAIVVMTAWASVDIAVQAMKLGANDFVTKPWDVERLLNIVKTQVALSRSLLRQSKLETENEILRAEHHSTLVFESSQMHSILNTFKQISASDACVLITGENGTGKSMLAELCHQSSSRANGPFISVNMGALAESVFESEIFGHEKGAFTGADSKRIGRYELADGGTLFLDEIANITEKQQATLLRLLESGEYERMGSSKTLTANVRVICATNAELTQRVASGEFRQDLYYRINTVPVHIPALRERKDDIPVLAKHFLEKYRAKYKREALELSECAKSALEKYIWPGNVRELEHSLERAALLTSDDEVQASNLGLPQLANAGPVSTAQTPLNLEEITLAQMEYQMLDAALIKYLRKPEEAAKALGISRSAFYRKLAKHGFELS